MSDETGTGNADYKLLAAVVKGALKDAAKGDPEAAAFVREMLPNTPTASQLMNDFIRAGSRRGVPTLTTGVQPDPATTPAATTANAGAHKIPAAKESTSDRMNKAIRAATGRGTA